MKEQNNTLIGSVLGIVMLLAGVQGAFAGCLGTAYFKAPSDWTQAIFTGQNNAAGAKTVTTKNADGYFEIDLSTIGAPDYANTFSVTNDMAAGMNSFIVTDTVWMHQNPYDANARANMTTLPCPRSDDGMVYVAEDVLNPGKTYIGSTAPDAKFFYVLVPEEKEWQSDDLMIRYTGTDGKVRDTSMIPSGDYCGWHYMVFGTPPSDAVLYLKNSPDIQLGINGLWDDDGIADPIDLNVVYEAYDVPTLFYIPDDAMWPADDGSSGWYTIYPDVEGTCSFTLAAIIYDTDESLNTAFTSDGNPVGPGQCVGVFTGLVKEDLGDDGKPVYSGSPEAQMCFGNTPAEAEANFHAMFNYAKDTNEVQCYDMPFRHYGKDSRWGFDSDSTHYDLAGNPKAKAGCNADSSECVFSGGFYPLEWPEDYSEYTYGAEAATVTTGTNASAAVVVMNGQKLGPTPAARTKREAAAPVPLYDTVKVFDHYCNTAGWKGGIDCGATHEFHEGSAPPVWNWGVREDWQKMNKNKKLLRNQQYCFQSHATFTYNESQEFTFRGDDDIWVFINKKLAVDNGGAHLAAPGHVVLKNLNSKYGSTFLVPGQDYPIDIFFCDRRRTMTNVIIKTNMYIKQATGLDFSAEEKNGGLQLNICVEKTGGGDCASVALGTAGGADQQKTTECGGDISTNVSYSITTRKGETPKGCADCDALPLGGTVHGGIDLSNPKIPIVYPDKITGLGPGNYRLVIEVDGKKTYYTFRIKGNLGIVSRDVTFENVDKEQSVYNSGTKWTFVDKALAGTRIPIYVSAPDDQGGVDLISAPGQNFTLSLTAGANLYKNKDDETPLVVPYSTAVNETGIDTFWVDVPLAGLTGTKQEIVASVGNTSATLTFYAPQLTFATPGAKDADGNVTSWNPVVPSQDPDTDEDGEEYFHWVGSDVEFYMVVMDPSTGSLCKECNFLIDALEASNGLTVKVSMFNEGVALVLVNSSKEYATEAASMVVGSPDNASISAPYGNMHFFKPPAPMPMIVDIFDVKGAPIGEMNIPAEYHNENADYLDGIADSLAIIYDRMIHPDSVPKHVCLHFDDTDEGKHLDGFNPFKEGLSNNKRDTLMLCSVRFDSATVAKAYANSPDGGRTIVFSVDSLSKNVKTLVNPENKIASFTEYEWKGKPVRTFFEKRLTDRIAPIILSARASTESDGGVYDQVKIIVSEPVMLADASNGTKAFTYYLNSAIDVPESQRYMNAAAQGKPQDRKDTLVIRYYNADAQNPTPHVGDYIRFRADAFLWTDTSNGVAAGSDTLRLATDADMHWNSPTNYNSTARLPSPWVQVTGDAKIDVTTISFNYADPTQVTADTPVGEVFPVKTNENIDKVKADHPTTLGHFVQSDMGSIIGSSPEYAAVDKSEVYFYYEVHYYTNLGNFVASQSGKIACNDPFFSPDPKTNATGDCVKNPRNFYVAWNMLSDNHRLVGTGAYITKYESFVKVGDLGKKAKKEKTEVWGVKRGKGKVAQ